MALTLATGSGTVAHSLDVRKDDLYETPDVAIAALCQSRTLPQKIWEPACGPGQIVRFLRGAGHDVVATDLVDYGCEQSQARRDFLMERSAPDGVQAIVTNPPFKLAEQFVTHAKSLVPETHMLLRLAFLEGLRWQRGLSEGLERVSIFAPRLPFMHRHDYDGPRHSNSGMPFAWFSWLRGYKGEPSITWINWRSM